MINQKLTCCDSMKLAQEPGTDNEGWMALVNGSIDGLEFYTGLDFPPIKFCPWCGTAPGEAK
jgi:hypothetical protein